MSPHMEEAIERYVRYRTSLTADERDAVVRLLEGDATARRLAEFYRSFYADLDALPGPSLGSPPEVPDAEPPAEGGPDPSR